LESTEVGIITDVLQLLTVSNDDAAVDDEPMLELISVELVLGNCEGIMADPIFNKFKCDLGASFMQSLGCVLMYALKLGPLPQSSNFYGNRLSVMHEKIVVTFQMSVLQGLYLLSAWASGARYESDPTMPITLVICLPG
jgi:hypothetical protein